MNSYLNNGESTFKDAGGVSLKTHLNKFAKEGGILNRIKNIVQWQQKN